MISPALNPGQTVVNAYFPRALWYNFADFSLAIDASLEGVYKELPTDLTDINVHVRGGNILPLQRAAMTTTLSRTTPFTLLVALCSGGKAKGQLYWDDGEQVNLNHYFTADFSATVASDLGVVTSKTFVSDPTAASSFASLTIETITILGKDLVAPTVDTVRINGKPLSVSSIVFDSTKSSITFSGLSIQIIESFSITWN